MRCAEQWKRWHCERIGALRRNAKLHSRHAVSKPITRLTSSRRHAKHGIHGIGRHATSIHHLLVKIGRRKGRQRCCMLLLLVLMLLLLLVFGIICLGMLLHLCLHLLLHHHMIRIGLLLHHLRLLVLATTATATATRFSLFVALISSLHLRLKHRSRNSSTLAHLLLLCQHLIGILQILHLAQIDPR